jgi:hypothetical protein
MHVLHLFSRGVPDVEDQPAAGNRTSAVLDLIDGVLRDPGTSEDAARFVPPAGRIFQPPDEDDTPWEVIDVYTRAEATADGLLIPIPGDLAANAGFRCPVALTSAAWEDCVAWTSADGQRKAALQDETGRLWDVIWLASRAIRRIRSARTDRVQFHVHRVPREGPGSTPSPAALIAHAGPGDDGELVITIGLPGEEDWPDEPTTRMRED